MSQDADKPLVTADVLARLPAEAVEIIQALLARIAELEARLGKNPRNSSLPPSSEHPHARPKPRRKPSGRKRGGQKGHRKHHRMLVDADQVDETIRLKPSHCRRCGKGLQGSDETPLRHQVFELPEIKPIITEYQRHRLTCACCGTSTTARLPAGVPEGQTGPRLTAFATLLMAYFRQSKRRTALFLTTLLNTPCSVGLTVKLQQIASTALRGGYEQIRDRLPHCETVGMDETPTKEGGKKCWLWSSVAKQFTFFAIRSSRSADVAKELLGKHFSGIVSCDRYAGYDWLPRRQHCWAHLRRDFQSLIDAGGKTQTIGQRLMDCTQQLFKHWHRYREGRITRLTMRRRIKELWWPVYDALEQGTLTLCGKHAGQCEHILERFDHLWTFLEHEDVEPTNNGSERSLRHAVIWRKLSFGTQSAAGSRFVERMLTVIETCRQQGRDVFAFVTNAIAAHLSGQPALQLLTPMPP